MEECIQIIDLGDIKNQPQIIIMSSENSESSDSYEFSLKKPSERDNPIMIKYKSVRNSRKRLGSEDIALGSGPQTKHDSKNVFNKNSNKFFPKNSGKGIVSNSVPMFGPGSFEKYEYNRLNATKIETKSGSQVLKAEFPSKQVSG